MTTKPVDPSSVGYLRLLSWSLDHRWIIVGVCAVTFFSTFPLYRNMGRDWMPQEDQSELGFRLEMPEGSSLERTERIMLEICHKIEKIPGVIAVLPTSSSFLDRVQQAEATILLAPPSERGPLNKTAQAIRNITKDYAYARPAVSFPNVLGGRETFSPIRATLLGPELSKLAPIARDAVAILLKQPQLADVRANLNFNNPELQVHHRPSAGFRLGSPSLRRGQRSTVADVRGRSDLHFQRRRRTVPRHGAPVLRASAMIRRC